MMYSGFVGHGNVFLADFYNFLAPTALTCANKGGTRELFFIVSARHSSWAIFSRHRQPMNTATNSSFRTNTATFPPLLPRLVNACLATVCGYGPTCGGVLFFLFFPPSRSLKNGDFSYRSRVPTAGICLW